mmetsp:Transcript_21315/g.42345  ORF Transcript_21315/g.42345 Transcript_21315/m.42345 type:complete len:369 (-) Transcript_21315:102-1208(-)
MCTRTHRHSESLTKLKKAKQLEPRPERHARALLLLSLRMENVLKAPVVGLMDIAGVVGLMSHGVHQCLINPAIVSAESGVQEIVGELPSVYERDGVRPEFSAEPLHLLKNLVRKPPPHRERFGDHKVTHAAVHLRESVQVAQGSQRRAHSGRLRALPFDFLDCLLELRENQHSCVGFGHSAHVYLHVIEGQQRASSCPCRVCKLLCCCHDQMASPPPEDGQLPRKVEQRPRSGRAVGRKRIVSCDIRQLAFWRQVGGLSLHLLCDEFQQGATSLDREDNEITLVGHLGGEVLELTPDTGRQKIPVSSTRTSGLFHSVCHNLGAMSLQCASSHVNVLKPREVSPSRPLHERLVRRPHPLPSKMHTVACC